jgi:type I restriction enzyme R subunit
VGYVQGYVIQDDVDKKIIDSSQIDFSAIRGRLEKKRTNGDVELFKNILSFKLRSMIRLNASRVDFQQKFEEVIQQYNSGSMNQESFIDELVRFSHDLDVEDRRRTAEGLTEEELSLFDKLKKPKISENDKKLIKNTAKIILDNLQAGMLVLDWRKKEQARALVRLEIEEELDGGLPKSYSTKEYHDMCELIFQHFFDNYYGDDKSIFSESHRTTPAA